MAIKTSLQNEPAPLHFHLPDLCHVRKEEKKKEKWVVGKGESGREGGREEACRIGRTHTNNAGQD